MEINKAIAKCMHLCSCREYCVFDIEAKLLKWDIESNDIYSIINTLLDEGYIDQERYTKAFINDKFKFNHWGKTKIKYHLRQKHIDTATINKFINSINEKDYKETIINEIIKKRESIKDDNSFEAQQKIARYVISKGFEPEMVFKELDI